MPPRYAYWTILVDEQPTAFRAALQEDLMPTFKRLQDKHPTARMVWFQNGKVWDSRIDAQEAMRARGEIGRSRDPRQGRPPGRPFATGEHRDRRPPRSDEPKLEWRPRSEGGPERPARPRSEKPEWRPRSQAPAYAKAPAGKPGSTSGKPAWKPRGSAPPARQDRVPARSAKLEWTPKSEAPADGKARAKPEWRPKGHGAPAHHERKPFRPSGPRGSMSARSERPEWKPKSQAPGPKPQRHGEKRKWIPKEEYKKSQGIEAKRDRNWRPGGEHKDPRQKYKDAKKAKWTRFKQTVRKRWDGKQGRKKKDE